MKRFNHYESYKDGSTVLKTTGIKDDLGRIIHEENMERYNGNIVKAIRDTVYTDENASCVVTIYHPDEISVDGHYLKSVITEKYEKFPYGIGIVSSSYATVFKDNRTEVESSTFEYDKYGVVLLRCINTNPDEYTYKRFVKYLNDDTDVVTILISNVFPIDQDESILTEEDLGFGKVESIVYDKRINKILSWKYETHETLYRYDFSVRGDNAYIEIATDDEGNTRVKEFNANGDLIRDKLVMKLSKDFRESRQYYKYEYDGRLLVRMTYSYEGTLPKHIEEHPEKVIVGRHYEYFDIEESEMNKEKNKNI